MKTNRYIFALILLMISTVAFSQVPRMLNHQGYLTNSSGVALDTTMSMTFRLFPDSSGGSSAWDQTMDTVTFTKGVFSVNLGPIDALFDQQYWLEVETGGEVINPRTKLTSVPYAMRSSVADNLSPTTNLSVSSVQTTGRIGIGTSNPFYNLHVVGSNPSIALEESGTSNANFIFRRDGVNKWYLLQNYGSPTDNLAFYDASIGTKVLQINPGGNVGIGTTTPYYRLHVKRDYGDYVMSIENQNPSYAYGLYITATNSSAPGTGSHYGLQSVAYYGSYNYGGLFYAYGGISSYGIYASASGGSSSSYAGYFSGNVQVSGTLSKWAGSFKIDHPLDPANKYLSHSFVESPDMMNIYNGIVTIDANGEAVVQLPAWFQALNKDYRYQLTAVGTPGPNLYISKKVDNNSFAIAGGKQGMEVSWQITGIRKDVYAEKHRIPVEENKVGDERGLYMMPELFGQPKEKGINYLHEKQAKEQPKRDLE